MIPGDKLLVDLFSSAVERALAVARSDGVEVGFHVYVSPDKDRQVVFGPLILGRERSIVFGKREWNKEVMRVRRATGRGCPFLLADVHIHPFLDRLAYLPSFRDFSRSVFLTGDFLSAGQPIAPRFIVVDGKSNLFGYWLHNRASRNMMWEQRTKELIADSRLGFSEEGYSRKDLAMAFSIDSQTYIALGQCYLEWSFRFDYRIVFSKLGHRLWRRWRAGKSQDALLHACLFAPFRPGTASPLTLV